MTAIHGPHPTLTGSTMAALMRATRWWKAWVHRWCCEWISVAYSFQPMADLADRHGQPDWAHALRSGCMPRERRFE